MPVTDMSGDDDWLQQFLAGHQAGQAFGASQPYGPQGVPGPYSGGPRGVMPGGGLMDRLGATPGAPSMGYPAMGQPGAQQPPAAAPGPAQGLSLTNNPIMHALNALNPISSAQAATDPRLGSSVTMNASQPLPPTAADSLPLAYGGPTTDDYQKWLAFQTRGSSPAAPTTANPAPRGGSGYGGVPPSGWGARPAIGDPNAAGASSGSPIAPARRSYVGQQPGTGAPAGSPSQTPATPQGAQSARFGTFQYQAPNSVGSRAPIYTALNLGSLFGGRGQPAANPANMPAPNAQPVSGALGPSGMSNAPWWMGPFQQGVFGPPSPDQIAGRGLKQRYG